MLVSLAYSEQRNTATWQAAKATGQPLWGDAAMFGLLRDNNITSFLDLNVMESKYPNLWKMYSAFAKIPAVKEWLDQH